jgi:hypothetical protein
MVVASLVLFQNFRSDVIWCTTKCCSPTSIHIFAGHQQGSQAKVSDLHVHFPVKKYIPHFQIAVNDPLCMHVFDSTSHLYSPEAHFRLCNKLPSFDHIHERSVWAKLEHNIGAFFI